MLPKFKPWNYRGEFSECTFKVVRSFASDTRSNYCNCIVTSWHANAFELLALCWGIHWWMGDSSVIPQPQQTQTQVTGRVDRRTIIPISVNKLSVSHLDTSACQNGDFFFQPIFRKTKTQVHRQLDRRTNAWNDNNTPRHRCRTMVSHPATSYCKILCHPYHLWANAQKPKMRRTNGRANEWPEGVNLV